MESKFYDRSECNRNLRQLQTSPGRIQGKTQSANISNNETVIKRSLTITRAVFVMHHQCLIAIVITLCLHEREDAFVKVETTNFSSMTRNILKFLEWTVLWHSSKESLVSDHQQPQSPVSKSMRFIQWCYHFAAVVVQLHLSWAKNVMLAVCELVIVICFKSISVPLVILDA